jgi:hypothetical protein
MRSHFPMSISLLLILLFPWEMLSATQDSDFFRSFKLTVINRLVKPFTNPVVYHNSGEVVELFDRVDPFKNGTFLSSEFEGVLNSIRETSGVITFRMGDRLQTNQEELIAVRWKIPENEEAINEVKIARVVGKASSGLYSYLTNDANSGISVDVGRQWTSWDTGVANIKANIFVTNKVNAEATIIFSQATGNFPFNQDTYIVPTSSPTFSIAMSNKRVMQWVRNGEYHQRWAFLNLYEDYYYIWNRDLGNVNAGDYLMANLESGKVIAQDLDLSDNAFLWQIKKLGKQKFTIKTFGEDVFWTIPIVFSNTNDVDLFLTPRSQIGISSSQLFDIDVFGIKVLKDLTFRSVAYPDKLWDGYFTETPMLYVSNGLRHQFWEIYNIHFGDKGNVYLIRNLATRQYLQDCGQSSFCSQTVDWSYEAKFMWEMLGTQWKSVSSGLCIDAGALNQNQAIMKLAACSTSTRQQWLISSTTN